jgi:hypothetical protein
VVNNVRSSGFTALTGFSLRRTQGLRTW